ncbi:uncharacterized protein LOC141784179 [Halichoeres trimaculatus]|uniref:uncharacterized protein LOC141784179 n=1 Tax=Halichoeres trimaculatus TaxID=147232 RepID=UPI003D9E8547
MEFVVFLAWTAMSLALHCTAGCPPPERLKYEWLDRVTVNVSWEKPRGLQDNSEVMYKYSLLKNGKVDENSITGTRGRNFTVTCLTEESDSHTWTYGVWTESSQSCNGSNESTRTEITVETPKPRGKIVKDFKCVIQGKEMDCSWDPVDPSENLVLFYRFCGRHEYRLSGFKECEHQKLSSTGARTGCRLKADATRADICILVETDDAISTFIAKLEIPSPELSVREEGNELILSWKPPEIGRGCKWKYEVCHKRCSNERLCKSFYVENNDPIKMAYDKSCLYELQSRVSSDYCKTITSDFTDVVTYGTNKSPDRAHTVAAIIIPILLSACVLLSCYCFRKHSAIICPNIPDPSGFIKDMMMTGNKEQKTTTVSVYEPVPEPVERCIVSPVIENSASQPNM